MPFRPRDAFSGRYPLGEPGNPTRTLQATAMCVLAQGVTGVGAPAGQLPWQALGGVHEVALDLSPLPQRDRVDEECCRTT